MKVRLTGKEYQLLQLAKDYCDGIKRITVNKTDIDDTIKRMTTEGYKLIDTKQVTLDVTDINGAGYIPTSDYQLTFKMNEGELK